MMRFFTSKEQSDALLDEATDPAQSPEEKLTVLLACEEAGGGEVTVAILQLRDGAAKLEEAFGGGSGNEVHDMRNITRMREPLAKLNLAIQEVMGGAKDAAWSAETCDCKQCNHADRVRNAGNN